MSGSFIVYVASQYKASESPDFASAVAEAKIAQAKSVLTWPFPAAVYDTDDAAKRARKANYFRAITDARGVYADAAANVARGLKMRVWVGEGITLTADAANKVYANVVAQDLLAELARAAGEVHISAGSEDPREYVS